MKKQSTKRIVVLLDRPIVWALDKNGYFRQVTESMHLRMNYFQKSYIFMCVQFYAFLCSLIIKFKNLNSDFKKFKWVQFTLIYFFNLFSFQMF